MNILNIVKKLSHEEKMLYIDSNANMYFRNIYYSKNFSKIVEKLNSNDKITNEEWEYLVDRLSLVTYKAIIEEDSSNVIDKISYVLNRIGAKVFKEGKIHNECVKMLAFLESIKLEKEINLDLLDGLDRLDVEKSEIVLEILLRQHREAAIFRDNQDAFIDSYNKGQMGVMTTDDLLYMDCMDRAYNREKDLVKEYK